MLAFTSCADQRFEARPSPASVVRNRFVFGANPTVITQLIDQREDMRVIDFTHVRFRAAGNASTLKMPDARKQAA